VLLRQLICLHSNKSVRFNRLLILLILGCTLGVILLNEYNLSSLNGSFPSKEGLITTADEYSYFQPVRNFLEYGCWSNYENCELAVIRTPGYGLIYLVSNLFGTSHSFLILKVIQILFFSLSLYLLFSITQQLTSSSKMGFLAILLYTLIPGFHGFTYYTLTESVLPFFVLFSLFFFLKKEPHARVGLIFSLGFLLLIRAQAIPFLLLIFTFYFIKERKNLWIPIIAAIPLTAWLITAGISNGKLELHPIYSNKNYNEYRKPHQELTELFKIWEFRSDRFHSTIGILGKDTTTQSLTLALKNVPEKFHPEITGVFKDYQNFRLEQRHYTGSYTETTVLPGEKELIQKIKAKRYSLVNDNAFDYYVLTPLKSGQRMFMTSMMNLHLFQAKWANVFWVKALKILSFLILISGFLCSIFILLRSGSIELKLFCLGSFLSILYLIFFQRLNEERYIVPYMSIWLISLILTLSEIKKGSLRLPFLRK
jgi:hypothetical protein